MAIGTRTGSIIGSSNTSDCMDQQRRQQTPLKPKSSSLQRSPEVSHVLWSHSNGAHTAVGLFDGGCHAQLRLPPPDTSVTIVVRIPGLGLEGQKDRHPLRR